MIDELAFRVEIRLVRLSLGNTQQSARDTSRPAATPSASLTIIFAQVSALKRKKKKAYQ